MIDQNNASETSGETEIVERLRQIWIDNHRVPHEDKTLLEVAETIKRLVAERDIVRQANENLSRQIVDDIDRAEAAEKRIAELEARYQQAKEALDKVRDLAEDGQSHGLSADLICAEIVAVIDALKGKQP